MRKTILLISMFVATVSLNAQVFKEYFENASPGDTLENYNDWYVSFKAADAMGESPIISEEVLFYENYAGSDTGMSVLLDSLMGQTDDTKRISTKVVTFGQDTLRPGTSGKMYAAFIARILPASWTSFRDFFTWEASSGSNFSRGRVFVKLEDNNQDLTLAVSKNSSSTLAESELIVGGVEVDHLLVLTYEPHEGDANDTVRLYINPDPLKSEAEQTNVLFNIDENSDYSATAKIKINVRQRGVGALVGGIRVGTDWVQVLTGVGDPTQVKDVKAPNSTIYSHRNEIFTSSPGFVRVYDITGRNVLNHITNGRLQTSLGNGIYIVRFEDNNGKISTGKVHLNAK